MQRIRVTYCKGEELMYTGNLDMHKVWERTFRRADLKLAYSQGFHPQPRLHQACPLPLGFTSRHEMLDFWLDTNESLDEIKDKLIGALHPGITIEQLQSVPLEEKPLQTQVVAAQYQVFFDDNVNKIILMEQLNILKGKKTCLRTRRGKEYDLLPLIKSISIVNAEPFYLEMTLSATPGATGRPEEVLDELGIDFSTTNIVRSRLLLID